MADFLNRIYKVIRPKLAYVYHNILCYAKTSKDFILKKDEKYAIVNVDEQFKTDDRNRYFYMLCMYLNYAEFKVVVKINWRDFSNTSATDFKSLIFKQKFTFVRRCFTPLNTVVLVQPNTPDHIIRLSYGHSLSQGYNNLISSGQFDCIAPYPMYALQYQCYLDPTIQETIKKSKRTIKILFSGAVNRKYDRIKVNNFFNVLSRPEVVKFISTLSDKTIILKKNDADTLKQEQLINSKDYTNKVVVSEVRTEREDWLKLLSRADFFICPPGVIMPWSHNCIEAMSVGTIPILQYTESFYPNLKHGENCLRFTNEQELGMAIENALAMEQSEIEVMRKNVFNYYNSHLSMDSVIKKIQTFSKSSQPELKVAIPFIRTYEEYRSHKALYPY